MKKIAIVADTNSGYTQEEAKAAGIYLVPMPFYVNGEEYYEGVNLTQEEFYEFLRSDADVSTSQPSPDSMMKLWDELLETYEEIVYIPMSSGLSGTCQTAMMLAQDYEGKVYVVDNQRISVMLKRSVQDAIVLAEAGKDAAQIKEYLEKTGKEAKGFITVNTLKYLKKGGRITPAAAALGTLLRIKPVLQVQSEKLDSYAKARTMNQARSIMLEAVKKEIDGCFGGNLAAVHLDIAYTENYEAALEFEKQVKEAFPGCGKIMINPLSLSVSCHIGEGALALTYSGKMTV